MNKIGSRNVAIRKSTFWYLIRYRGMVIVLIGLLKVEHAYQEFKKSE